MSPPLDHAPMRPTRMSRVITLTLLASVSAGVACADAHADQRSDACAADRNSAQCQDGGSHGGWMSWFHHGGSTSPTAASPSSVTFGSSAASPSGASGESADSASHAGAASEGASAHAGSVGEGGLGASAAGHAGGGGGGE